MTCLVGEWGAKIQEDGVHSAFAYLLSLEAYSALHSDQADLHNSEV